MGEVLTTMKIMPDSPDIDLESIKEAIKNSRTKDAKDILVYEEETVVDEVVETPNEEVKEETVEVETPENNEESKEAE